MFHRTSRRTPRATRPMPLRLLGLEDRCTPTAVSWDGGAGTLNWADANNWSTNALPGAGDDVTADPTGFQTIVYNGPTTTIQSLKLSDNLQLNSGSIAVTGALTVFNAADVDIYSTSGGFSAAGATALSGGTSFVTRNGSVVNLPGLTSFTG